MSPSLTVLVRAAFGVMAACGGAACGLLFCVWKTGTEGDGRDGVQATTFSWPRC